MGSLIGRELAVVLRHQTYWAAAAAHVAMLMAFVVIWAAGIPTFGGSVLDQAVVLDAIVLACVLPWVGVRCGWHDREGLTRFAALLGIPASHLLAARTTGAILAGGLVACTALPALVVAQQIAAAPVTEFASAALTLLPTCLCAAVLTATSPLATHSRLGAWFATTVLTLVASRFAVASGLVAVTVVGLALAVVLMAVRRAHAVLRYVTIEAEGAV